MNKALILFILFGAASTLFGAEKPAEDKKATVPPPSMLEKFYLKSGRQYVGIWDAASNRVHLVTKSNHVGNLTVKTNDILKRETIGDASQIKVLTDVELVERGVLYQLQLVKAGKQRVTTATQSRDRLHESYKGKNLDTRTYDAVMKRYKAADDEVANAQAALDKTMKNFETVLGNYQKLGGKTDFRAQIPP